MGTERDAAYYNDAAGTEHYLKPYNEAPWFYIWEELETHLSTDDWILDCGCGAGQFARMLFERGFRRYTGIDFSGAMIGRALDQIGAIATETDRWSFAVRDLRSGVPTEFPYDVVVFSEVLEHLADDVAVLSSVQPGKRIVFSVPNYDDPAHVRVYPTAYYVNERYKNIMSMNYLYWLPRPGNPMRGVYIGAGVRN